MGAYPFKIYSQKHIISTEFYVEFMCFWDNALFPQIEIDGRNAVLVEKLEDFTSKQQKSSRNFENI